MLPPNEAAVEEPQQTLDTPSEKQHEVEDIMTMEGMVTVDDINNEQPTLPEEQITQPCEVPQDENSLLIEDDMNQIESFENHQTGPEIKLEHEDATELLKILDESPDNDAEASEYVWEDPEQPDEDDQAPYVEEIQEAAISMKNDDLTDYQIMEYEELEEIDLNDNCMCVTCEDFFDDPADLEEHNRNVHNQLRCELCSTLVEASTFEHHLELCETSKPEPDDLVSEAERTAPEPDDDDQDSLWSEREGLLSSATFECFVCHKSFMNATQFRMHCRIKHKTVSSKMRSLPNDALINCSVCQMGPFKTQVQYDQHVKMHENMAVINSYLSLHPCHTCHTIFVKADELQTHVAEEHKNQSKRADILY